MMTIDENYWKKVSIVKAVPGDKMESIRPIIVIVIVRLIDPQ